MTAHLVRNNVWYMAKSTDIVDDKIDGVSMIGVRVYTIDDKKWYVVDDDLTLIPFVDPMLETA